MKIILAFLHHLHYPIYHTVHCGGDGTVDEDGSRNNKHFRAESETVALAFKLKRR